MAPVASGAKRPAAAALEVKRRAQASEAKRPAAASEAKRPPDLEAPGEGRKRRRRRREKSQPHTARIRWTEFCMIQSKYSVLPFFLRFAV